MQDEIDAMIKTGTWTVQNADQLPNDKKLVKLKWVFKTKLDQNFELVKCKSRLVAQGFTQVPGVDYFDTYAPVLRKEHLRLILSLAAEHNINLRVMDIQTAFLHSDLDCEIYTNVPPGFEHMFPENSVLKLNKAIYGLKQSPRLWNGMLDKYLRSLGYRPTCDPCVYIKHDESGLSIVGVYVDDIIYGGPDSDNFFEKMREKFPITDLGELGSGTQLLGAVIVQRKEGIYLTQAHKIQKILEDYHLEGVNPRSIPIVKGFFDNNDSKLYSNPTRYRSLIGSLNYICNVSRPDISYAISVLSRHLKEPKENHWHAAVRVVGYLKGTMDLALFYPSNDSNEVRDLIGFSDADWAGDKSCRRSTSGVAIFKGGLIHWKSKLQSSVALSTCESELVACSLAAQELMSFQKMRQQIEKLTRCSPLYVDNQAAVIVSKDPANFSKLKHVSIRHFFVRDAVAQKQVAVEKISGEFQIADMFTKPLDYGRFTDLREKLLLRNLPRV
jgi:histone deacetylase 1/2